MTLRFSQIAMILTIAAFASASKGATNAAASCASLTYTNVVADKPDLLTMNVIMHGICRMRSNETQSTLPDYNVKGDFLVAGLSYDPREQAIYHSGMGAVIYKTHLYGDGKQQVVYTLDWESRQVLGIIQDIAYDWVNRGMYVLFENAVGLVDLKAAVQPARAKILRANESIYQSIEVHPERGYLFLLQRAYDNVILRTNLEGSDRVVLVNFTEFYEPNYPRNHQMKNGQLARIESMALDVEEDRLYWTVTPSTELVRNSALDGSDERRVESTPIFDAGAMAVGKKYVYYSRRGMIKRYEKRSGTDDWRFGIDNANDISVAMLILSEEDSAHPASPAAAASPTTSAAGLATESASWSTRKIDSSSTKPAKGASARGSAAPTTLALLTLLFSVTAALPAVF